jgi:hypothetical protein
MVFGSYGGKLAARYPLPGGVMLHSP